MYLYTTFSISKQELSWPRGFHVYRHTRHCQQFFIIVRDVAEGCGSCDDERVGMPFLQGWQLVESSNFRLQGSLLSPNYFSRLQVASPPIPSLLRHVTVTPLCHLSILRSSIKTLTEMPSLFAASAVK